MIADPDYAAGPVVKPPAEMTDAELNAAMASEVMGWKPTEAVVMNRFYPQASPCWRAPGPSYRCRESWSPSTDIVAAFEVVKRMMERFWFDISTPHQWREWYEVEVHRWNALDYVAKAKKDTLPRAICEAALAAVRSSR